MCAETSQRNKNNHVGFHPPENLNQVNKLTAQHALLKLLCKNKRTFQNQKGLCYNLGGYI
jgi:hypothetical protein